MSAAAEKFMPATPEKADALPWLKNAPKDKAVNWINSLRATGGEIFSQTGLPVPNDEGWQYTNLRDLKADNFLFAAVNIVFDANSLPKPLLVEGYRIVLVNGQLQKSLSTLPPQAEVMPLMDAADKMPALDEHVSGVGDFSVMPFLALNAAHLRDGFVLKLAAGKEIDKPVEVLFYTLDGSAAYPRVIYWLGENSGATIVENYAGAGAYLAAPCADIVQERASRLKLYRFYDESEAGSHVGTATLTMLKDAQFEGFSGSFGGGLNRQEIRMRLLEKGVCCSIGGIYLKEGRQSQDFTILADHFEENGTSSQHFKGVIDDQARAIFQGKIHVRRSAQKADGYQSHHALLLSQEAEASAKPELEIYADDVKCSHGATSGQIDKGALFYLQSRGIPADEARALLIQSFLNEDIEKISSEPMRDIYQARVLRWLAERGGDE